MTKTAAPLGVDDLLTVVEKVICETKDRYAATELRRALDEFAALPIPAPDAQAVAWLGEGDGFKSFTRKKSVADRWRKGGIAVTEVATPVTGEADDTQ